MRLIFPAESGKKRMISALEKSETVRTASETRKMVSRWFRYLRSSLPLPKNTCGKRSGAMSWRVTTVLQVGTHHTSPVRKCITRAPPQINGRRRPNHGRYIMRVRNLGETILVLSDHWRRE